MAQDFHVRPSGAMSDRRWLFVLFLTTMGAFGFECVDRNGCTCQPSHSGDFEFYCPSDNDSSFIVNIFPEEYLQVQCYNKPDLKDFNKMSLLTDVEVKSMYFRFCLPPDDNISFGELSMYRSPKIIEKLVIQSYKNVSNGLKRYHLRSLPSLQRLVLSSNGLTKLDADVFVDLPNLNWLELRENSLRFLPEDIFNSTPNLEVLELGNNDIEKLEPNVFRNLKELKLLNIWRNSLTEIKPGVFDGLVSLKSLDLNYNSIDTIASNAFAKLTNMTVVNLSYNNFTILPENLLRNNTILQVFTLNGNKRNMTTFPNKFFANLTQLHTVKLSSNGFTELPEDLFWGATALNVTRLDDNQLKTLPAKLFRDAVQLRVLDLSVNFIESLPDEIFANTSELIYLDLSRNYLTSIGRDVFVGLKSLKELNIEHNLLRFIHGDSFRYMKRLEIVRLTNNELNLSSWEIPYFDEYGKKSPFYHVATTIRELYLGYNNITEIFSDWIISSPNMEILDLKYNNIMNLSASDLQFFSKKIIVDLTNNQINHIYMADAEQIAERMSEYGHEVTVYIDENPLICDCSLYNLLRYFEGKMHPSVQECFYIKKENLTCIDRQLEQSIKIEDLRSEVLMCFIDDERFQCFDMCECQMHLESQTYFVNCSNRNLTEAPKNLKTAEGCQVDLNFNGNKLTSVPYFGDMGIDNLSGLRLSHNNITNVSLKAVSSLTMQVLELDNNNITRIDQDVLDFFLNSTALKKLTLDANPLSCECEDKNLLSFIQRKFLDVHDLLKVTCGNSNVSISNMTANDFCPINTGAIIAICLTVAFLGLIIGTLAALYYRYQQEIKVWLYAHQWCLWFVTENELDKGKHYDAFVSYSHKDEHFIVNELVPNLESGPKRFKLCLHYRDWMAGEWIPNQIARSVEDSKRTIIVLSPNFLESVWGRMEFRAAHNQALSEGRARVIVILYGEIGDTESLDPELKAYLSMNTYVKWGDPWFWDKLRYALPHPPELTRAAARKNIFEKHQPTIRLAGEKELIYPSSNTSDVSLETTPPADSVKVFLGNDLSKDAIQNRIQKDVKSIGENIKYALSIEGNNYKGQSVFNRIQCTTV